jgi:hypothetical protein
MCSGHLLHSSDPTLHCAQVNAAVEYGYSNTPTALVVLPEDNIGNSK